MTDEEWIKTIPSLSATALLEDLDYCGYDSYYRTIREPVVAEIKKRLERTETLEKENAELKTRVENQKSFLERIRAKFELGKLERKEIEGYLTNEQLSAAKDLLKRWVDDRVYTVSEQKDLIADTEQFLEEEY